MQIGAIKKWSGVATAGKKGKAVVAVRTAGDIEHCTWINKDADEPRMYRREHFSKNIIFFFVASRICK